VSVSCAVDHTLALLENGEVAVWGFDGEDSGKLGLGLANLEQHTPRILPRSMSTPMKAVAAGGSHSLAVSRVGQLYAWGDNDSGALALGMESTRHPKLAGTLGPLGGTCIEQASAGVSHSLLLSAVGEALTVGTGAGGRLGHGSHEDARVLTRVQGTLSGQRVVAVAAGPVSSLALTAAGEVYRWGWLPLANPPAFGETIGELNRAILSPERVALAAGLRFSAISAGESVWMAVSEQGRVYVWYDEAEHTVAIELTRDHGESMVRAVTVAAPSGACGALAVDCDGVVHVLGGDLGDLDDRTDDPLWVGSVRKLRLLR
jgi:alpha-tubulin suppressor-like RCC1 family protein